MIGLFGKEEKKALGLNRSAGLEKFLHDLGAKGRKTSHQQTRFLERLPARHIIERFEHGSLGRGKP
ncbi:MAG: hypothetical protein AAB339_03655 [Elusimicrobiota bacterium]